MFIHVEKKNMFEGIGADPQQHFLTVCHTLTMQWPSCLSVGCVDGDRINKDTYVCSKVTLQCQVT